MGSLMKLAHTPPVTVTPTTTVLQAVEQMSKNRVGAVAVLADDKLVGIFTERDVMEKVVLKSLDPKTTEISRVMTSPVETAHDSDEPQEALERMVRMHIRHLPVSDASERVLGILSIRNLLQHQLEITRSEADSLEAYYSADGPGG